MHIKIISKLKNFINFNFSMKNFFYGNWGGTKLIFLGNCFMIAIKVPFNDTIMYSEFINEHKFKAYCLNKCFYWNFSDFFNVLNKQVCLIREISRISKKTFFWCWENFVEYYWKFVRICIFWFQNLLFALGNLWILITNCNKFGFHIFQ